MWTMLEQWLACLSAFCWSCIQFSFRPGTLKNQLSSQINTGSVFNSKGSLCDINHVIHWFAKWSIKLSGLIAWNRALYLLFIVYLCVKYITFFAATKTVYYRITYLKGWCDSTEGIIIMFLSSDSEISFILYIVWTTWICSIATPAVLEATAMHLKILQLWPFLVFLKVFVIAFHQPSIQVIVSAIFFKL